MPLTKQYLVGVRMSHLRENNTAAQPSMQVYLTSGNCSQEAIMFYWVKHGLWRKPLNLGCRQLLFVAPQELLQSVRQAEHAVSKSQQPSAAAREPAHLWRHASRLEACQTPLCHRQCQGHAWSRDNILPTQHVPLCSAFIPKSPPDTPDDLEARGQWLTLDSSEWSVWVLMTSSR